MARQARRATAKKSDSRKPTPEDKVFGRRLQEARKRVDKNQQWLAAELGITYQQLGKYERGESSLKVWMLAKAAKILGVPGSAFLEDAAGAGFAEAPARYESEAASADEEFRRAFERAAELWPSVRRKR